MPETVREVMTSDPVALQSSSTIEEAAKAMSDNDIGPVIVLDDGHISGIVTDRDIVVRAIAEGRDPHSTRISEICSGDPTTLSPDQPIDDAIALMREKAIRRVPVVEGDRPVGIVSIGDLAIDVDRGSALADISAARPNN